MSVLRVALVEMKRLTSGVLPWLVLIAMSCIPLLYGYIYLYGNWDAYSNVKDIKGVMVVTDKGGTSSNGEYLNTGQDVEKNLLDAGTFKWSTMDSRDQAVDAVTRGEYNFALVIGDDFTEKLLSAGSFVPDSEGNTPEINPEAAGIEVITNDANNYVLTNIVTKMGTAVRDSVAAKVGDKTANTLLASFTTIHGKMGDAADGATKVNDGAVKLSDALSQIKDGTATLKDGSVKLKDGSATLKDGTAQLTDGSTKLVDGQQQLSDGATKLSDGASELDSGAQKLDSGAKSLADGTSQLSDGTQKLEEGSKSLAEGSQKLADGTVQLKDNLDKAGVSELPAKLNSMCQNLAAINTSEGTGNFGTDLSNTAVSKVGADLRTRLQPLVDDGTMSSEALEAVIARVDSEETKKVVAELNDQALNTLLEKRGASNPDLVAKLQQLKTDSCAADGTSSIAPKVTALNDGVNQLNTGASQLATGAKALHTGATTVNSGASKLDSGAQQLSEGTGSLTTGTSQLSEGASTLAEGEKTALDGQKQLADGAQKLDEGAGQLKDGTKELADGSEKLADGSSQAKDGSDQLKDGTGQLSDGLSDGTKQIPNLNDSDREKVAGVMSDPVELNHDSLANGRNYGEGMAPFFMALALWIGALMLVQTLRPMNSRALASHAPSMRIAIGSWIPFALVGAVQVALMYAAVVWGLGFEVAHPVLVFLFLCVVSLTFTAFIHGLVVFLGSPGKIVALIILILQLISAGGAMPYETLPEGARWLHNALPMSYAVTGMRRLSYGIDIGSLWGIVAVLLVWALAGLLLNYFGTRRDRVWSLKKLAPEIVV